MLDGLAARFDDELRAGDDRALWEDVAARVADDAAGLDVRLESPPRHVTLALVRMRRRGAGVHADDDVTLRLAWERDRGAGTWTFAGARPHLRRRHGFYSATACLPAGTTGLAWVDVAVLWRPRAPWALQAAPDPRDRRPGGGRGDHETGRQTYRYRREADGSWRFVGVHEA
jgi:hypothetical protein